MAPLRQAVEVTIVRIPIESRWASERWQPARVEIASDRTGRSARDIVPGECLCERTDAAGDHWRCSGFEIELHATEAEGYYLNLSAPDPCVFVMWRSFDDGAMPPVRPVVVTVSYNEAARFMDAGEQVDTVPMIPAIADWLRPFVAANYKPEPRRKVRRNDPVGDSKVAGPGEPGEGFPRR